MGNVSASREVFSRGVAPRRIPSHAGRGSFRKSPGRQRVESAGFPCRAQPRNSGSSRGAARQLISGQYSVSRSRRPHMSHRQLPGFARCGLRGLILSRLCPAGRIPTAKAFRRAAITRRSHASARVGSASALRSVSRYRQAVPRRRCLAREPRPAHRPGRVFRDPACCAYSAVSMHERKRIRVDLLRRFMWSLRKNMRASARDHRSLCIARGLVQKRSAGGRWCTKLAAGVWRQ